MTENTKTKFRASVLSSDPYKRRTETEMIKIVSEVNKGMIGKLAACSKYGVNRNTLALFIKKVSIRTLGTDRAIASEMLQCLHSNRYQAFFQVPATITVNLAALKHQIFRSCRLDIIYKVYDKKNAYNKDKAGKNC